MKRRHFVSALLCAGTILFVPQAFAGDISISGTYLTSGRNVEGQSYEGTAHIVQDESFVSIEWQIGSQHIKGAGAIDGKIVTVDWGSEYPVVYLVMPDGELHGTWADGLAFDKLTPQ
ncbi:hypothetical protein ROA7450_01549 [Roseovarius albus]|uniref:Uncharacterized protein n=1 Tax=Roseovarius albus TaxID=1247867 RepID=A0A1X6YZX6_9RHOB|nr:hypothetical protein [Roseovarius albus]SLN34441.1 hypothetical protein ROA7450_01549 [Roseovarius albus]